MRIKYGLESEETLLADEECPTVQCPHCELWMCDCEARAARCEDHFEYPCLREVESE